MKMLMAVGTEESLISDGGGNTHTRGSMARSELLNKQYGPMQRYTVFIAFYSDIPAL